MSTRNELPFDALLFDLDNTLYDYTAYWRWRLQRSLCPVAEVYPQLDCEHLTTQAIQERVYARDFAAFLERAGVSDAAVHERACASYRENDFRQIALFDGVAALLHTLRARYRLGLITNGPVFTQRPKIEHLRLAPMMDVLLVSEEVGIAKPDPAIFHLALEELAVAPARALYVGDSLEHDLRGAQAAGLAFAWMNAQGHPLPKGWPMPLATVRRLPDLVPLLGL